jgi:hypothetical protein
MELSERQMDEAKDDKSDNEDDKGLDNLTAIDIS